MKNSFRKLVNSKETNTVQEKEWNWNHEQEFVRSQTNLWSEYNSSGSKQDVWRSLLFRFEISVDNANGVEMIEGETELC